MQSVMSVLAQQLWADLQPLIYPRSKIEAAQRIVDLFQEYGCEDIHECVQLMDTSRVSLLDSIIDRDRVDPNGFPNLDEYHLDDGEGL